MESESESVLGLEVEKDVEVELEDAACTEGAKSECLFHFIRKRVGHRDS